MFRLTPALFRVEYVAFNGDTVLVNNGTYYENINFVGKSITVGTDYYIDGDTSHIVILLLMEELILILIVVQLFILFQEKTLLLLYVDLLLQVEQGLILLSFAMRIGGGILCFNSACKD